MKSVLLMLSEKSNEPKVDIAICFTCDWRGPVGECETEEEGDWESGYYQIHICPKCPGGGCIDDYDMTPGRAVEWQAWYNKIRDIENENL